MLQEGLYELPINRGLLEELEQNKDRFLFSDTEIDKAEASKVLTDYVARMVEKSLQRAGEGKGKGIHSQIELANRIVSAAAGEDAEEALQQQVDESARQLLSVAKKSGINNLAQDARKTIPRPETPMSTSSLFTGSAHEPQMFSELKKEVVSADSIDMLVSFIKWSGLVLILDELKEFASRGGRLRVITTSYIGATDVKAVEELRKLPNAQVKVSYDTKHTRLHAKAYIFRRNTGFSTAYVGSSNLSNPALSSGLEWNLKITRQDQQKTMDKIDATFETYWESDEFEVYDETQTNRLERAIYSERHSSKDSSVTLGYLFDINPYPFQQAILDRLRAEREIANRWKNLVVAATGTGKTVISALDYRDYCKRYCGGRHARLLFVAHRKEILEQSRACFRGVLKDPNFGDMLAGLSKPNSLDHLFVSIQSFNSKDLSSLVDSDYYEFIIVDEFHHAAAASYRALLEHFAPKVLLGLTATPERMDKKDITIWFDGRIAAEIRLPEAIDRKLLCPFQYFGITDIDEAGLKELKWSRGGYDKSELTNLYVFSERVAKRRASYIATTLDKYVADLDEVKGLGFCVSIEHAKFMSEQFNEYGIPSMYLTGESDETTRSGAKDKLISGEVKFIFVVDIYNEGVDIPEVNTVMFLRPTESLTIFLQQLGRGLRHSEGKECLTVLDFVGQANKRYNFEEKFAAILNNSTKSLRREIEDGFTSVPKGCFIQLERIAQQHILDAISRSFDTTQGLVDRIEFFEEDTGKPLTLTNFLNHYHLDPRYLYKRGGSFSRLCARAGVLECEFDEASEAIEKALSKLCQIDSQRWIRFLIDVIPIADEIDVSLLTPSEQLMLDMLQITVWPKSIKEGQFRTSLECLKSIRKNRDLCNELLELLQYRLDTIDFVDEAVDFGFDCPLDLHCSYTRDQIFVALGVSDPSTIREGVKWLKDKNVDVLINTLNKADKDYSPTTMYEDYALSDMLFHWQSQSTTSEQSETGQRYIHHKERGSKVALFVREYKRDAFGLTGHFCFLGLVNYVRHEGSRPMSIIWKLERPIPAKYLRETIKLAG